MRYFLDTEFIEDGKTIDLISIGIINQRGDTFYKVSNEFDESKASQWVKDNVLPNLGNERRVSKLEIKLALLDYIGAGKPEFWGYYNSYDWVVFCQIFGTMMDLPKGWPMYCKDIKQLCSSLGNPRLPEQGKGLHNALADAEWTKQAYEFLTKQLQRAYA